jgi:hypothetical protein
MLEGVPDMVTQGFLLLAASVPTGFLSVLGFLLLQDMPFIVQAANGVILAVLLVSSSISVVRKYRSRKAQAAKTDVV